MKKSVNIKSPIQSIMVEIGRIGINEKNTKKTIDNFVELKKLSNYLDTHIEKQRVSIVEQYKKTGKAVMSGYVNFVSVTSDKRNPVPNYHLVHNTISELSETKWKMRVNFKRCFSNPLLTFIDDKKNDLTTGKVSYVVSCIRGKNE